MIQTEWPGALESDRAGETVLGGTLPHIISIAKSQRASDPTRIRFYRIDRWLTVCEVMR